MRHSIVIALSLLVGACASQPQYVAQTSPSSSATAFVASPPGTVLAEQSGSSAVQIPADIQQVALAPEGAEKVVSTESDEQITELRVVPAEEADSGRVCESRQRPGSRMEQTFCYTRQEQLVNQEAREALRDDQLADLQREQRWRDEIVRQAEMSGRRPTGFGLGPN